MAHSAVHFSAGLIVGTAALAGPVIRCLASGRPAAGALRRMLLAAYALGAFAVVPGLLPNLGVPQRIAAGWWMNLFLFHPLIDRARHGGVLVGEALIVTLFAAHYALVLSALWLARRRSELRDRVQH